MSTRKNNYFAENPQIEDKGITKHPKIDNLDFPVSKKGKLMIIYCNPSGYGFLKKKDDQKFFGGELTGAGINKTIMKFNKIIDLELVNKKVEEGKDYNAKNIFFLNILFVLGLLISLVMYILALYDVEDFKEKYIIIPLILLLLIIVLGMMIMMMGLMQKREFKDLDLIITDKLQMAIKEENEDYQNNGFSLKLGEDFGWFEIKKIIT